MDLLARMLRYWPVVALMMIVGGLAGWAIHQLRPPLYESQASFTFAFNLARTGLLTEKEEDYAMGAAAAIMTTAPIPELVISQAGQQGITLDPYPLNRSVFLERKSFRWIIRVRLPDPQAAAFVANAWAEAAHQQLKAAVRHAEQAELLRTSQEGLVACLKEMVASGPAAARCSLQTLAEVQRELQATSGAYEAERIGARGYMPYLIFNPPDRAVPGVQPVQFGANGMVLAGVGIGFLLALFAVLADLPQQLATRIHRVAPRTEHRS